MSSSIHEPDSENFEPTAYFLLKCPSCNRAILAEAQQEEDDSNNWYWSRATRLWPHAENVVLSNSIPENIRKDIEDALKCFKQKIYSATAVLCGRALERIVVLKTNEKTIARGLRKLKEQSVIDEKLFNWAEALRQERNISAHASESETTKENAQDVLDFSVAICDYIFTLNDKYSEYMSRKGNPPLQKSSIPNEVIEEELPF